LPALEYTWEQGCQTVRDHKGDECPYGVLESFAGKNSKVQEGYGDLDCAIGEFVKNLVDPQPLRNRLCSAGATISRSTLTSKALCL
jgi:hypothetical protein